MKLEVYPNPVANDLMIDMALDYGKSRINIYSMQGQLVQSQAVEAGILQHKIPTNNLKQGMYMLEIKSEKHGSHRQTIIKQ